ncbi:hypothetical protein HAX54_024266, partial [Datura stramonium]|nr:hypothetical protein [Datura stramonium]
AAASPFLPLRLPFSITVAAHQGSQPLLQQPRLTDLPLLSSSPLSPKTNNQTQHHQRLSTNAPPQRLLRSSLSSPAAFTLHSFLPLLPSLGHRTA